MRSPDRQRTKNIGVQLDWGSGRLSGSTVQTVSPKLGQIRAIFRDLERAEQMDPDIVVYQVQFWLPVMEGTEGGLFWGMTTVEPGKVGDEYFMTHGHFHQQRDRAEIYVTLRGEGALILMSEANRTWVEHMGQGIVNYIPGWTAHRVANIGEVPLVFAGCWPSDAGHDYEAIRSKGFSSRLREIDGQPFLVSENPDESLGD